MTDNGCCLPLDHARGRLPGARASSHLRTRPYRPQTNGKAERFIRTMLGGWAYAALYRNSARADRGAMPAGSSYYNYSRQTRLPRPQAARQLGSPS